MIGMAKGEESVPEHNPGCKKAAKRKGKSVGKKIRRRVKKTRGTLP